MSSHEPWEHYKGREQTAVKHYILREYLQVLALKLGNFKKAGVTINYVDGFSGPWDEQAKDLSDTSPGIALHELSEARRILGERGVSIAVRCMFIEKEGDRFRRLADLEGRFPGVHITRLHGTFEAHIPEAVEFASGGGDDPFGFVFIDPTGWTGYGLRAISPLLRVRRCEVLVNFMTEDILRHIGWQGPANQRTFADLFGSEGVLESWKGLGGVEREDKIVASYCDRLGAEGNYRHVARSIVPNPTSDRTRYHLIYATRSGKGLIAFREVERKSLPKHDQLRSAAKRDARIANTGQQELLPAEALDKSDYLSDLCRHFRALASAEARNDLMNNRTVPFDAIVDRALRWPFVSEVEVNQWIRDWRREHLLDVPGLSAKKMPHYGQSLHLQWTAG